MPQWPQTSLVDDLASPDTGSHDADPLLFDTDHVMRLDAHHVRPRTTADVATLVATLGVVAAMTTLLVVTLMATRDNIRTPADQPSPTVTVPPTTPPRAMPNDAARSAGSPGPGRDEQLAPGTYYVDEVDGTPTPRIFATIGAGWRDASNAEGWSIAKNDADIDNLSLEEFQQHEVGGMAFSNPVAVYSDACHWEAGYYPGPVDTLDGLVAALTEQQGWAELTTPSDVSIDGYVGKAFQRTVPTDLSDCSMKSEDFRSRVADGVPFADIRSWDNGEGWGDHYHEPGQIETLWVLDLDGTMVVITTAAWPEPSVGADADFAADVLDSIHIDRP